MKQSDVMKLPDGSYRTNCPGVYLIVQNGGKHRSWSFRIYRNGHAYKKGLGSVPKVSLLDATDIGLQIQSALAEGKSFEEATAFLGKRKAKAAPAAVTKPKKPVQEPLSLVQVPRRPASVSQRPVQPEKRFDPSFGDVTWDDVAEEAIRNAATVRAYKDGSATLDVKLYRNQKYISPILGSKTLKEITVDDVLDVLKPHWHAQGSTEIARKCRAIIELVFSYAKAKKLFTGANPAIWKDNLEILLPSITKIHKPSHRSALGLQDLQETARKMMGILESYRGNDRELTKRMGMAAVIFGFLTVTRVTEFAEAKWFEVDFENAVWSVDPSHRKGVHEVPHRVPLSRQAIELLKLLPEHESEDDFVFKGLMAPHIALGSPRLILQKYSGEKTTMHGVRSTFRDWAETEMWHRSLAESALSHQIAENATEAAYLRTDLLEKRRPMMQAWADALLPTDNIHDEADRNGSGPILDLKVAE